MIGALLLRYLFVPRGKQGIHACEGVAQRAKPHGAPVSRAGRSVTRLTHTCSLLVVLATTLVALVIPSGAGASVGPVIKNSWVESIGPVDEDIFSWPEERRRTITALPSSLGEALDALERDSDFLVASGVFSQPLIERWISKKRAEAREVAIRTHPYELELYYDL